MSLISLMSFISSISLKRVALFLLLFFITGNIYSQNTGIYKNGNEVLELKTNLNNLSTSDTLEKKTGLNSSTSGSTKSPFLAALYSIIIPGAGHFYINRMDVGKYFFGIDVASWMGYGTLTFYGNNVIDDAETFSVEHAGVTDPDNKNDDYYSNVGNYANIYDYNNYQLAIGNYSQLYNVATYYWDWDDSNNQNIFESQRKSSERIYNSRIIFGSILVANRIVSGISAYLLANQGNKKKLSYSIQPELLMKKDYTFDGVRLNLIKNF